MVQVRMSDPGRQIGPDRLGRYYTKADIGHLLIDQMANHTPSRLLDLGAGGGSLSSAAINRWSGIEVLTVDIDRAVSARLIKCFGGEGSFKHRHIQADALSDRLPDLIFAKVDQIDTAVCNPPFIVPKWRKGFAQILEETGFSGCIPVVGDVDAALLFLAQNLRLLSNQATLGIILPDSLISATRYRRFRKELLQRYKVHKAIRLPRGSFSGTDALASIVIISKGSSTETTIKLSKLRDGRELEPELLVDIDEAVTRLDFDYHAQRLKGSRLGREPAVLGSIVSELKRGSVSSSEARAGDVPIFHTSDMSLSLSGEWCDLGRFSQVSGELDGVIRAQPGDILVARVGRNLERKVLGVLKGSPFLTDCVYRIQVPEHYRDRVLAQLSCADGQAWLASRAYGVGAKQLTKADLLTFPLCL
jgi:type I restriction enzyme M protein